MFFHLLRVRHHLKLLLPQPLDDLFLVLKLISLCTFVDFFHFFSILGRQFHQFDQLVILKGPHIDFRSRRVGILMIMSMKMAMLMVKIMMMRSLIAVVIGLL